MEKDEREKKLKAGKEKLAAFQKKKSKKKKSRAATGGESLAGEYAGTDQSVSSADLSSSSDVPFYDSDQQSANGDDFHREDTKTLLKTQVALRSAHDRIEELEETLLGKQLALDNVISENTKLKSKLEDTKIPELELIIRKRDEAIQQLSNELQTTRGDSTQTKHMEEARYLTEQVQQLQSQIQSAGKLLEAQASKHNISNQALQHAKTEILNLQDIILEKDQLLNQLSEKVNLISKEYKSMKLEFEASKQSESKLSKELQARLDNSDEIQRLTLALAESQRREGEMKETIGAHNTHTQEMLHNLSKEKDLQITQMKDELHQQFCLDIDELNSQILRKVEEYTELLQRFNESEDTKRQLSSQLEQMTNVSEEATEISKPDQSLREKTADYNELQAKLSETEKENERLVQELNLKEQTVLELEEFKDNHLQILEKLKEYEKKVKDLESVGGAQFDQEDKHSLDDEMQQLKRENIGMSQMLKDYKSKMETLEERLSAVTSEPASKVAQDSDIPMEEVSLLSTSQAVKEPHQDVLHEKTLKIQQLEHKLSQLQANPNPKIVSLQIENDRLSDCVKNYEEKIKDLEHSVKINEKENNEIVASESTQNSSAQTELNEKDSSVQEVEMIKESYSKMSILLNEYEQKIQSLEGDTAEIHLIREDNARISELLVVYEEKIEMLERKLQDRSEEAELNLLREDNTKMSELLQVDEEKIHDLEEKLQEMPSEVDIERVKRDYPKLAEILKVYEQKTYSLQLQLQEKCDMEELNFLQEDNYRMSELLKVYEEKIQSLELELQSKQDESVMNQLKDDVSKLTEVIKDRDEKIRCLEERQMQYSKDKEQLSLEMDQLNEECEQMSQQLKLQDTQLKESQTLASQLTSLQQEYHFYRNQNDELKNKINIQQDSVISQKSQLEVLFEEHSLLKEQLAVSQQEVESLTLDLNKAAEDKSLYLNQVKTLENELTECKVEMEKYCDMVKHSETEIQNSKSEIEMYKSRNFNLEEDMLSLRLELERSQKEAKEIVETLRLNLQESEREKQEAEEKLIDGQLINQQYSDQLMEKETLILSLKSDLQDSQKKQSPQVLEPNSETVDEVDVDWSFSRVEADMTDWTPQDEEITEEKMEAVVEQFVCESVSELDGQQDYSVEGKEESKSQSLMNSEKPGMESSDLLEEKLEKTIYLSNDDSFGFEQLQNIKHQILKMEEENKIVEGELQARNAANISSDFVVLRDSVDSLERERESLIGKLQHTMDERDKLLAVISTLTVHQQSVDQTDGPSVQSEEVKLSSDTPSERTEEQSHQERVRNCMQTINDQPLICQSSPTQEGSPAACLVDSSIVNHEALQSIGAVAYSGDSNTKTQLDTSDKESGDIPRSNTQQHKSNSDFSTQSPYKDENLESDKSANSERLTLVDAMENVSSLYEKQQTELETVTEERNRLKKDLDIFKVSISELQGRHESLEDENDELLDSLEKVKAEYEDLKTNFENLQDHYDMLGDDNHTLKLEYDQLMDKFNALSTENETLNKSLNDSDVLSSQIYSESAELMSRLTELEDVNANLDENLTVSSEKICKLENENESLKSSLFDTREKLRTETESNEKLQKKTESLSTEVDLLETKNGEILKRIQSLEEEKLQRQDKLGKAETLQDEKDKLLNYNENLKSQVRMLNFEKNEKIREFNSLQEKVESMEKEKGDTRTELERRIQTRVSENQSILRESESLQANIEQTMSNQEGIRQLPPSTVKQHTDSQVQSGETCQSQLETSLECSSGNISKVQSDKDSDSEMLQDLRNTLDLMRDEKVHLENDNEELKLKIVSLDTKSQQLTLRLKEREENLEVLLNDNDNMRQQLSQSNKELSELKAELCKEVENRMEEKAQSISHLKDDICELKAQISIQNVKPEGNMDESLTLPLENLHKNLETISQHMAQSYQAPVEESFVDQEEYVTVTLGVPVPNMSQHAWEGKQSEMAKGSESRVHECGDDKDITQESSSIESVESENQQLLGKIELLNKEIKILQEAKGKLDSLEGENSKLRDELLICSQNNRLVEEYKKVKKDKNDLTEIVQKKEKQTHQLEDNILQLVEENVKVKVEAVELQSEMKKARDKMMEQSEVLQQFLLVNSSMNEEVSDLKQELLLFSDSKSSLDTTLSYVEGAVHATARQVKEIEDKFKSGRTDKEILQEQAHHHVDVSTPTEGENDDTKHTMLQDENRILKSRLQTVEGDLHIMYEEKKELTSQIKMYQEKCDKLTKEIALKAETKIADGNTKDLSNSAMMEHEQTRKILRKKTEENEQLGQKIKILEEKNDKLEEELEQFERVKKERDELLKVHDAMADEFSEMKCKYEAVRSLMEDTKKECNKEIQALRDQLTFVNKDVFTLKDCLETLESDLNASADQKLQLIASLEEEQRKHRQVVAEQQRLQELNEKFNKDMLNQRKANETLLSNLADSRVMSFCDIGVQTDNDLSDASDISEKLKDYETQIEQLSTELADLKLEYEKLASKDFSDTGQTQPCIKQIVESSLSESDDRGEHLSLMTAKDKSTQSKEYLSYSEDYSEKDVDFQEEKTSDSEENLRKIDENSDMEQIVLHGSDDTCYDKNFIDTPDISEYIETEVQNRCEKKLEQMEYEMEERFEMEYRDRKLDLMVKFDKEKKDVAENLQQAAKQKMSLIQAEKQQEFVQALQKMKKDFDKKLKFELEKQKWRILGKMEGQSDDVVQKLSNENQDLEKANDALALQLEQLQRELQALKGSPKHTVETDSCFIQENENHSSTSQNPPPSHNESVILDWEFSPFDFDGDIGAHLNTFEISCQRQECQHLLEKYKELSDQLCSVGLEPAGSTCLEGSFEVPEDIEGFEPEVTTPTTELEESFIKETFDRATISQSFSQPHFDVSDNERGEHARALSLGPPASKETLEEGFIAENIEKDSFHQRFGKSHSLDESHFDAECVELGSEPKSAPLYVDSIRLHDDDDVFIGEGFVPNEATGGGVLAIDKLKETAKSKMKEKSPDTTINLSNVPTSSDSVLDKSESVDLNASSNNLVDKMKADLNVKEHEIRFLENKIETLKEFYGKEKHGLIEKCRSLSVQMENEVLSRKQLEQELITLTEQMPGDLKFESDLNLTEDSSYVKTKTKSESSHTLSTLQSPGSDIPAEEVRDVSDSKNLPLHSSDLSGREMPPRIQDKISSLESDKALLQRKIQSAFDIFEKEKLKFMEKIKSSEIELQSQILSRKNVEEELDSLRKTLHEMKVTGTRGSSTEASLEKDLADLNLNQEIDEWKKELSLKNVEVENLSEQVREQSKALIKSSEAVTSLEKRVETMTLELQGKEKMIDELDRLRNLDHQQIEQVKGLLENTIKENQDAVERIQEEKHKEMEVWKEKMYASEEICKQLECKVSGMENSLRDKEDAISVLNSEAKDKLQNIEQLKKGLEEMKEELENLEVASAKEMSHCKTEMHSILTQKDAYIEKRQAEREAEKEILKRNQEQLEDVKAKLTQAVEFNKHQDDILKQNENEIAHLQRCNEELESTLKEKDLYVQNLVHEKENEIEKLQEELKEKAEGMSVAKESDIVQTLDKAEYDQKIVNLQAKIEDMDKLLTEKEQSIKAILNEKENEIQLLKDDLERLSDIESKYKKSQEEISKLNNKGMNESKIAEQISELKVDLTEKESYINKLEDEMEMLNSELEQISSSQDSEKRFKNLKETMEKTLKEKDTYIKKLEEHLLGQSQSAKQTSVSTPIHSPRENLRGTAKKPSEESDKASASKHSRSGHVTKDPLLPWMSPLDDFSDHSTICSASSLPRLEHSDRAEIEPGLSSLPEWQSRSGTPMSQSSSSIDGSDRIVSGLDPEQDGHVALENKHFELINEISDLRKDLRETKAIYTQENALLQEALDRERWMKNSLKSKLGMSGTVVKFDLSAEVVSLRQKVAVLQETNKMLRMENDKWLTRIQDQERLVISLREQIGEVETDDVEVESLFSKQVALLQRQREELFRKLQKQESENTRLSEKLSDKAVLEENLRREKDLLKLKLQEKEDIEMELWQKRGELQRQMEMQRKLEEILYHKNQIEKELMKQKRLLELDLCEIEAKLQEKEELLHVQKNQLLKEIKQKDQLTDTDATKVQTKPNIPSSKRRADSDASKRVVGRLQIQLNDAERQHSGAVETLKEKLKCDDARSDDSNMSDHQKDTLSSSESLRTCSF